MAQVVLHYKFPTSYGSNITTRQLAKNWIRPKYLEAF